MCSCNAWLLQPKVGNALTLHAQCKCIKPCSPLLAAKAMHYMHITLDACADLTLAKDCIHFSSVICLWYVSGFWRLLTEFLSTLLLLLLLLAECCAWACLLPTSVRVSHHA
jgi:hypothetical protein